MGVQALGSTRHIFLSVMATYVGLDPANDIDWVTARRSSRWICLSTARSTPSWLSARAPGVRARNIDRVILNSASDRPWSQYFCCMLAATGLCP